MELHKLALRRLSSLVNNGELSISEIYDYFNKRIVEANPRLNIFLSKLSDKPNHSIRGPLAGVPFSMKDVHMIEGYQATAGSKVLKDYFPNFSTNIYKRLQDVGAFCIGKTNCDAWGHGSSTENSDYGPTCNPHNVDYVPGGSSGGSAAAVAAGLSMFDIGEDTGGSIRQPAAFCGVVGLKVSYGLVSRYGTTAYASSLDTVGPITRTVTDCATVLSYIVGKDCFDAMTVDAHSDYEKLLQQDVKNLRIGLPREYFVDGVDPEVKQSILDLAKRLEANDAKVTEVSLPLTDYAIATYYLIATSETSSNLARYDGIRYGHDRTQSGTEQKRRIILGTYTLSAGFYDAYYKKATQVRHLIIEDFAGAFKKVDLLMAPTAPTVAFRFGVKTDPLQMYLGDIFTVPVSLAGLPALVLPIGKNKSGLPLSVQLIAPMLQEGLLLQVGRQIEQIVV